MLALTVPVAIQLEEIYEKVDRDPQLKEIKEYSIRDANSHPDYTLVQERLLYQGKLVVPKNLMKVSLIMHEFHDRKLGGHTGVLNTQKRIFELFYWDK